MKTTEFNKIVSRLKEKIHQSDSGEENFQTRVLVNIDYCATAYNELRNLALKSTLNQDEEIYLFKVIKPYVLGEYMYYSKLFEIQTQKPVTSIKEQKKFFKRIMLKAQQFFNENREFYHYHLSGSEQFDDKYFVRTKTICWINPQQIVADLDFSTSHDYKLAMIKFYRKITEHCKTEMNNLKAIKKQDILQDGFQQIKTTLFWTAKKRALLELIYGIYSTRAVNNGKVDIKDLVKVFEIIFNIKLAGFYHTWFEIRQRKIERTRFIDLMKNCLINLMEDADER
jgi:hypothetical protein